MKYKKEREREVFRLIQIKMRYHNVLLYWKKKIIYMYTEYCITRAMRKRVSGL